jgi:hypothetical protein
MMTTIYVAQFKWGEARLVSVEMVKETEKQYQVDKKSEKAILSRIYVPSRINKDDRNYKIFLTLAEAQQHCAAMTEEHIHYLDKEIAKATASLKLLKMEMKNG